MIDIGFVGLGNMGAALSRRLMQNHRLHVWDKDISAIDKLVAEGALASNGPGNVAPDGVEMVFLCLPTSSEVEEVLFNENGLAEKLTSESIVIDMTTGDPIETKSMAARLEKSGIYMIDAPVSGGVIGAENGTIAIMVGAPESIFLKVTPVLKTISPNLFRAGEVGSGHAMKLINNMISSCIRLATFEGLALATKAGIEPMRFAEILSKGSGRGYVADTALPNYVIPGRLDQKFSLALMYKDLSLATQFGRDLDSPLKTGAYAREVFLAALNELGEDVDITQLIKIFERAAGVDICDAQKQF